jgi:3-oxoacyl-[acyl-carrier-protein] synthase-1
MVYFIADNITTSLGFTTSENFKALKNCEVGIKTIDNTQYYPEPFPASLIDTSKLNEKFYSVNGDRQFTRLEKMMILSITDALKQSDINISSEKSAIIISTTKGNIDLLEDNTRENFEKERVLLWRLGQVIGNYFENPNEVIVLSNACISGVLAINTAAMMIKSGMYENVIVCGGDIISEFVVSGFMSFLSLSPNPCRPFDAARDGLSLGEGAGTLILSNRPGNYQQIAYLGGASANDANHISGPSRTGEGSYLAIKKTFAEAQIGPAAIDHISSHGTATLYNDEMESLAIDRHGLNEVPLNSFKGNWGHTLGAAGVVETVAMLREMKEDTLVKSAGYRDSGVSKPVHVITETHNKELKACLKMASGFGGSNAALIAGVI